MTGALSGKTVLVPESRELDLFSTMLEAEGARTLRCPLVAILDLEDPAPVEAWLQWLIESRFDDLILMTGEGLRRILSQAERMGRKDAAIRAIGALRRIVRGPKPIRVLREIGLTSDISAAQPTTDGLIESLGEIVATFSGRRVAVQLYPGQDDRLGAFLRGAGAGVSGVTPYRYASHAETGRVIEAIRAMAAGEIDVVAFTSSPQIARLVDVARDAGIEDRLKEGLVRTKIASIGPVVTAHIAELGIDVAIEPRSFHLKPLVRAIIAQANPHA